MAAAAIAFVACAMPAHAGRPLQTDDAGVVDRGACEIEAAAAREHAAGAARRLSSAQLACGIPAESELALAAYRGSDADGSAYALELNGKTRLSGGGEQAAFGLAYGFAWARPEPQSPWRHVATRVSVVHTRSLAGDVTLHANLGHLHDRQERHGSTTWGLAVEYTGAGAAVPMVELIGDDHGAPCWNVGLRWTPFPAPLSFDISYGRQATGGRPSVLAIGLTQAF